MGVHGSCVGSSSGVDPARLRLRPAGGSRCARRSPLALACAGLAVWVAAGGTVTAGARSTAAARGARQRARADASGRGDVHQEQVERGQARQGAVLGHAGRRDGRTACATCHFNAGADNRSRNQINPRRRLVHASRARTPSSRPRTSRSTSSPTRTTRRRPCSRTPRTCRARRASFPSAFNGVTAGEPADDQTFATSDPDFQVGGTPVRRTTGRNTPSVINAVFNFRNFWDGRAQNDFNGVEPVRHARHRRPRGRGQRLRRRRPGARLDHERVARLAGRRPARQPGRDVLERPDAVGHRPQAPVAPPAAHADRQPQRQRPRQRRRADRARHQRVLRRPDQERVPVQVVELRRDGQRAERQGLRPHGVQLLALLGARHPGVRGDARLRPDAGRPLLPR